MSSPASVEVTACSRQSSRQSVSNGLRTGVGSRSCSARGSWQQLRTALTVRTRRRVRRDTTVSIGGTVYEVPLGYLAGQVVTIATSLFDDAEPVLELDGKRISLRIVDPVGNNKRPRPPRRSTPERPNAPIDFDPSGTLVETASEGEECDEDLF